MDMRRQTTTPARRLAMASLVVVVVITLYLLPMYVPVVAPTVLAPSAIDKAVPFLGWTVWIYYSYAVFLVLPFGACHDEAVVARTFQSLVANSVIAAAVFFAWPTAGVAQQPDTGGVTGLLWIALQTVDRPMNLFPSLHIANACTCALALSGERRWRAAGQVWAVAIAISTLTTKQHLFADLLGGVVLAGVSAGLTLLPTARAARRRWLDRDAAAAGRE